MDEIRPTLIIGLGGTGSLGVKKAKEKMPAKFNEVGCVRYVVFDTTAQPGKWTPLSNTEYFDIGGFNANRVIDSIRGDERYKWFPDKLRPGQINFGAMGIRAIGRLCYFQKREEIIRPVMLNALSDITDAGLVQKATNAGFSVTQERGIDIHVISSVCGGTGAGMLLDLIYDLRKWAEGKAVSTKINVHFVLPEAFVKVDAQSMTLLRANTYALLKEIDYFTASGKWSVMYRDEVVEFHNRTPFDFGYLLNGERKTDNIDRDRLAAIIGETIVVITASPVGRTMGDQAINLAQQVLSQLDDSRKPRAYSSYGISVGEIPYDKMYEIGRNELRNVVIDAMIENGSIDKNEVDNEVEAFLNTNSISPDRISNYEPEIQSPRFEGLAHIQRRKEQFKGAARRYLDNYFKHNKLEFVKAKADIDELKAKFHINLEKKTVDYKNERERRIPYIQVFLEQVKKHLQEFSKLYSKKVVGYIKEESGAKENLETSINEAVNSGKLAQMEQLTDLLTKNEKWKHKSKFYQHASDICNEMNDYVKELFVKYQKIIDFLRELKKTTDKYEIAEEALPERFAICNVNDIMETFRKTKNTHVDKFLAEIETDLLSLSKQSEVDAGKKLDQLCAEALKKVLDDDSEFECQNLLFSDGDVRAEEILKNQIGAAIPAWRVDDIYPKENIRSISVIGALGNSRVARLISQLLLNIEPTGTYHRNEIPILQTEHGLSLWGLAKMREYLISFRKLQELEGKTSHQLHLDKCWNWEIPDVFPEQDEDVRAMEFFTLANMFGWINKIGLEYCYVPENGNNVFLDEGRAQSFAKFRNENKGLVEEVKERVRENIREIGDNQRICAMFEEQMEDLEKRIKATDDHELINQFWREKRALEIYKEKLLSG